MPPALPPLVQVERSPSRFLFLPLAPQVAFSVRASTGIGYTVPPTHGADGTLYAVDESGTLTAIAVADGTVKWTFTAAVALRVAPALACDGTLYLGSDDGTGYARGT